jgi:anti-anti-sigma regulatory factor
LEIRLEHRDDVLAVALTGEFDLAASHEFRRVLGELRTDGIREVEIDLRPVVSSIRPG